MNNLFYSLPEKLRIKITRMNPHPVADVFKWWIEDYDSKGSYYKKYTSFHEDYFEYYNENKRMRQWVNKQYQNGNRLGFDD